MYVNVGQQSRFRTTCGHVEASMKKNIVHNNDYLRCTMLQILRLPCGKTSFLLIWKLYNKLVHAVNYMLQLLGSHNFILNWCTSRLPCGNFIPKFGHHLFFPWVSRTAWNWFPWHEIFHDHMWNLPWKKASFTTMTYLWCTCCTSNQLRCGKTSFPVFPWVSRTRFSQQMPWMRFQASPTACWTTQLKFTSFHPQQRGLLSFICELQTHVINECDGLVGFKGGSKSLSVLKTAVRETYTGRRISPSYQLRTIFGLLKAC